MMLLESWSKDKYNPAVYDSPSHTVSLLLGLNQMRNSGYLLDLTIIAEAEEFQVHRVVLASCSEYFRAMFTDEMKESKQDTIKLKNISAKGLRSILEFIYTGQLCLNLANVQAILSVASHLDVLYVIEACSSYLMTQLDLENCLDIAQIADTYSLQRLKKGVYKFLNGHLLEFSKTKEFESITYKQFQSMLSGDFPVDCSEADVLRVMFKFVHNTEIFRGFSFNDDEIVNLLEHINFNEIPTGCKILLDRTVKSYSLAIDMHTNSAKEKMKMDDHENILKKGLINSRGLEESLIKIGGFSSTGITNEITYFQHYDRKWRRLTTIPHVEQCNYGAAVYKNQLFIIGGCYNQTSEMQENVHCFGFRYNPISDKWTSIATMVQERCRFTLNVVKDHLYAIGGWFEFDGFHNEDHDYYDCERYCPRTNIWERIAPIPEYTCQHAATVYPENGEEYLFVSGGMPRDEPNGSVFTSFWKYCTNSDVWERMGDMSVGRADHAMFSRGNDLYVCGGWNQDEEDRVLVDTIDRYNFSTRQWEMVTKIPTPRFHAGIVNVADCVYFIGGYENNSMAIDRSTALVECYNFKKNEWTIFEKYPEAIWEHICVSMYIPRCRDDPEVKPSHTN